MVFIQAAEGSVDFFLLVATLGEVGFVLLLAVLLVGFFVVVFFVVVAAAGLMFVAAGVAGCICDCEPVGGMGDSDAGALGAVIDAPFVAAAGAIAAGDDAAGDAGNVIVSGCPGAAVPDCDGAMSEVGLETATGGDGAAVFGRIDMRSSCSTGKRSASGDFASKATATASVSKVRRAPVSMPQRKAVPWLPDRCAIGC